MKLNSFAAIAIKYFMNYYMGNVQKNNILNSEYVNLKIKNNFNN